MGIRADGAAQEWCANEKKMKEQARTKNTNIVVVIRRSASQRCSSPVTPLVGRGLAQHHPGHVEVEIAPKAIAFARTLDLSQQFVPKVFFPSGPHARGLKTAFEKVARVHGHIARRCPMFRNEGRVNSWHPDRLCTTRANPGVIAQLWSSPVRIWPKWCRNGSNSVKVGEIEPKFGTTSTGREQTPV